MEIKRFLQWTDDLVIGSLTSSLFQAITSCTVKRNPDLVFVYSRAGIFVKDLMVCLFGEYSPSNNKGGACLL
jgi:hypothetical protein